MRTRATEKSAFGWLAELDFAYRETMAVFCESKGAVPVAPVLKALNLSRYLQHLAETELARARDTGKWDLLTAVGYFAQAACIMAQEAGRLAGANESET